MRVPAGYEIVGRGLRVPVPQVGQESDREKVQKNHDGEKHDVHAKPPFRLDIHAVGAYSPDRSRSDAAEKNRRADPTGKTRL
jgi:hypothetical protein